MDKAARGMLDVARSVLAELDLEVVLERVLESARELTGARYAALGVLYASGNNLDRFLTLGLDDATRAGIGELPRIATAWIEPAWKMVLSNKGILPVLWKLFPRHPNLLEAQLNRLMVQIAARVMAVCDSSKFGRSSLSSIVPLANIHGVITDKEIPRPHLRALKNAGIETILV